MHLYDIFFIHSSTSGQLGNVHILSVVSSATMDMGVEIYFRDSDFNYFGYIPRNGIAGLYGSSNFKVFKKCLCYYNSLPFPPPLSPALSPLSVSPRVVVHVHQFWVNILWFIPSPSFIVSPHLLLAAVSLFHISKLLYLFCSLAYCVH